MSRVVLATPAGLNSSVDAYYHHSVINTVKLCAKHGIDVIPLTWPGEALVQHARNALVKIALQAKPDQVFMIDADQEWEPEQFLRLVSHPVDVVGATYRKKQDKEEYVFRAPATVQQRNGLLGVFSLGTGFLRVSAKALQTVWAQAEPYEKNGEQFRMVFDIQIVEGRLFGEDTVFCARLVDAGFPVWLDPSFTVGHNGYGRYRGDFQKWLENEHARQRAASGRTG